MPTLEAVQNTLIPKVEVATIPTRTVITKPPKLAAVGENPGQTNISNSSAAEPATTAESVKLSPQVSALARKEQAFRQREQALKERERAMEARLADADKFEQLKAKLTAKDYSEAEALGLDYDAYTKYKLDKIDGENPQDAKIQALEAKIEAMAKGNEESAASQFEETVAEYKKEISKVVGENPDFSSIKGIKGGEESVLQLILDTFEEDGEELTIMEAAKMVEDQILERGKIYSSLPKLKMEAEPEQRVLPRPVVGKTLTNDMTASSAKTPLKPLHALSEGERYAEARRRVVERREKGK